MGKSPCQYHTIFKPIYAKEECVFSIHIWICLYTFKLEMKEMFHLHQKDYDDVHKISYTTFIQICEHTLTAPL